MSAGNANNSSPSKPIPINTRRGRAESVSDSSSSEESASPVSPSQSPLSTMQPRVAAASPSSTPILSYFLSQSPKSPGSATFPFRRGFGTAAFEDDSDPDLTAPKHQVRRASTVVWPSVERTSPPVQTPVAPSQEDRAAGLLRRLSLGGSAFRPPVPPIKTTTSGASAERVPPNTPAVERPPQVVPTLRKARRSNTISPGSTRPKRAPSPMGERILTGHFDGFN